MKRIVHEPLHGKLDGETYPRYVGGVSIDGELDDFSIGFLLGLLVGEGHFGGDGRQPQITLRMHVRHEKLFRWLQQVIPGSRLYGPYNHGGRSYYQWMVRGTALKDQVVPLIARRVGMLDDYVSSRFVAMCARYDIKLPDR